ncbi:Spy/CpxP family protein refolding chaperone [Variovorax paradoxus]|uniref:LTXXQ motif family protein n=1 Tax=Variovorax paradoxus (strain S110) TaxID=543728 RepID=C5CVY0_VARPS|nr:Spy/CpxP family protein refolding chaperone [Variovorax paradoxus]
MISLRQRIVWASLLGSAALASSGAFAQQAPAAPGTSPSTPTAAVAQAEGSAAPKAQHKRMDPAQRMERMQEHRTKRLAALKEKLKLNAGQESAWTTFAAASQPPARTQRMDRAEFAKLTTPERLERMQARQAERSARFAKRTEATKAFYAALTPEQQKTFDAETVHVGMHGHRGHHRHGGADGQPSAAPAKS